MSIISGLLQGVTVEIKSNAGNFSFAPFDETQAKGPNPFLRLIAPKITVRQHGEVLATETPAGEPFDSPVLLYAMVGIVAAILVGTFALGRATA